MDSIIIASDRSTYFQEAANKMGVLPIIIEKDFWVCWMLEKLFSINNLKDHLTFKGGTSLSKVYQCIERFSEDIDLTLDRDFVGVEPSSNPFEEGIGTNECDRRFNKLREETEKVISDVILPSITQIIDPLLEGVEYSIRIDPKHSQTILFSYPEVENYRTVKMGELPWGSRGVWDGIYIGPTIKLEFGARGANHPTELKTITPYLHTHLPSVFEDEPAINVNTLSVSRTFWEKVTILHAEHHRSEDKDMPTPLSRHYYDTAMLFRMPEVDDFIQDTEMLRAVVEMKKIAFKSAWASYDTATPGQIKLSPASHNLGRLKTDYQSMQPMFFRDAPDFDQLMEEIQECENRINA